MFMAQDENFLREKTVGEFFAAIGLMRLGLEQEGWAVAFANDLACDKFEMYSHNFEESTSCFVFGDIHNLDPKQIPTVTMATASFPATTSRLPA